MLALILAGLVGTAPPALADTESGNAPRSVDCWLLEGEQLMQARDQGLCGDAFSRNSGGSAPPVVTDSGTAKALAETAALPPPSPPTRKPAPPVAVKGKVASAQVGKRVPVPPAHRTARSARAEDGDFFTRFGNDWNALVRAVEGALSGTPQRLERGRPERGGKGRGPAGGRPASPPVMDHRGR